MTMAKSTMSIKKPLDPKFNTDELLTLLCYDYYPLVYNKFSSTTKHLQKIEQLVSYCKQNGHLADLETRLRENPPKPSEEASMEMTPDRKRLAITSGMSQLELVVDGDLADFTPEVRKAFQALLAEIVKISTNLIKSISIDEGSIIWRIQLPTEVAEQLLDLYEADDPILQYLGIEQIRMTLTGEQYQKQIETVRAKVLLDGRVQGIGMRYYIQQKAIELGLTGFVRNLTDGRVEVVFEGPSEQVEALLTWFQNGPEQGRIDSIAVRYEEPEGKLNSFTIQPGQVSR